METSNTQRCFIISTIQERQRRSRKDKGKKSRAHTRDGPVPAGFTRPQDRKPPCRGEASTKREHRFHTLMTTNRGHRSKEQSGNVPSSSWCRVLCLSGSIAFPKTGCFKARLRTTTSESLTPLLLNNLAACREMGTQDPQNIVGLVPTLQSDAQPPHPGRTLRLGHLPKSRRTSLECRAKAAL